MNTPSFQHATRRPLVGWVVALFWLTSLTASAQAIYQIDPASKVKVDGTSTLHDWSSAVNEFDGEIVFNKDFVKKAPKQGLAVEKVAFKFKVESMEGGRGTVMNNKIYKALKSETSPYIEFVSTAPGQVTQVNGQAFTIVTKGNLSMAGITKPVEVTLEGKQGPGGGYLFTGTHKINMRTYDIEPPSAMFGQIVTGEEITVVFDLVTKAKPQ